MITTALMPTIADGEPAVAKTGRAKSSKAEGFADLVRSCMERPKKDCLVGDLATALKASKEESSSTEPSPEEAKGVFFSLLFLPGSSPEPVETSSEEGGAGLSATEEAAPDLSVDPFSLSPSDEEGATPEGLIPSELPEGAEALLHAVGEKSPDGVRKTPGNALLQADGAEKGQDDLPVPAPRQETVVSSALSVADEGDLPEEGSPKAAEASPEAPEAAGDPTNPPQPERSVLPSPSPDRPAEAMTLTEEEGGPDRASVLPRDEAPRKDGTGEDAPSSLSGKPGAAEGSILSSGLSREGGDGESDADGGDRKPAMALMGQEKAEGDVAGDEGVTGASSPVKPVEENDGITPEENRRAAIKEGPSRAVSDEGQSRSEKVQPQSFSELLPSTEGQRNGAATALTQDFPRRFTTTFPLAEGLSGAASATIRLGRNRADVVVEPPALGRVEIHFRQGGQGIEATLRVDNEGLRQLVQGQIDQLRTALQQAGIALQGLSVDVRSGGEGPRWAWAERKDPRKGLLDDEETLEFAIDLEQGLLNWMA